MTRITLNQGERVVGTATPEPFRTFPERDATEAEKMILYVLANQVKTGKRKQAREAAQKAGYTLTIKG